MKKKKLLSGLLALSIILGCAACNKSEETKKKKKKKKTTTTEATETLEPTETPSESETTESTTEETTTETTTRATSAPTAAPADLDPAFGFGNGTQDDMTDRISQLDRVVAVEKRGNGTSSIGKYYVIFEMPLDWGDPSKGSFYLRSTFSYKDDTSPNTFLCNGYMMYDMLIDYEYRNDVSTRYDTNELECEHRFYGASVPKGLSNTSPEYWEYLTAENAAADFHHIITEFKKLLSGKWIFTGGSKGGQLTMFHSLFYPDDCAVYLPVVAPGGVSDEAPGFFDFIYNEIGNDAYGEAQAAEYRKLVLDFQVEAMKLKPVLADRYYQDGLQQGNVFTDFTTPEILYDMSVLDFATQLWQYYQNFSAVKKVLDLDHSSDEFIEGVYKLILEGNPPMTWAINGEYFAYYVQAATQNGEHDHDFSYIRERLKEEGLEDLLTITEDMEKGILFRMVFTPEMLDHFTYDQSLYNELVKWSHTTKNLVIMVYGGADVWYSMRLPDVTDNPNVHTYVAKEFSHIATIAYLPANEQTEIDNLVMDALGI